MARQTGRTEALILSARMPNSGFLPAALPGTLPGMPAGIVPIRPDRMIM